MVKLGFPLDPIALISAARMSAAILWSLVVAVTVLTLTGLFPFRQKAATFGGAGLRTNKLRRSNARRAIILSVGVGLVQLPTGRFAAAKAPDFMGKGGTN